MKSAYDEIGPNKEQANLPAYLHTIPLTLSVKAGKLWIPTY